MRLAQELVLCPVGAGCVSDPEQLEVGQLGDECHCHGAGTLGKQLDGETARGGVWVDQVLSGLRFPWCLSRGTKNLKEEMATQRWFLASCAVLVTLLRTQRHRSINHNNELYVYVKISLCYRRKGHDCDVS